VRSQPGAAEEGPGETGKAAGEAPVAAGAGAQRTERGEA
jgi:hypothetical protein